jgi:hypothetical protein
LGFGRSGLWRGWFCLFREFWCTRCFEVVVLIDRSVLWRVHCRHRHDARLDGKRRTLVRAHVSLSSSPSTSHSVCTLDAYLRVRTLHVTPHYWCVVPTGRSNPLTC